MAEAFWSAIRRSQSLFAYYSKHAGKGGKKANVKVARKMALITRSVATRGQLYQEDYLNRRQREQHPNSYRDKKDLKAERFSSGFTEQRINKKAGNRLQIACMPG